MASYTKNPQTKKLSFILGYIYQVLGYYSKQAVPSELFMELGLLNCTFQVIFAVEADRINNAADMLEYLSIRGKALQVLNQMACLHSSSCLLHFSLFQEDRENSTFWSASKQPMTLPQALLSITCSPVHATPSLFRKVLRILYNLSVDDTNELLLLILKDPWTSQFLDKGFQNEAFTSCKYELTQNG